MSTNTSIEWCDSTWNPIAGCTRVSEGCRNCYAERMAHRFAGPGQPYDGLTVLANGHPQWSGKVSFFEKRLLDPLKWKKPRRIFVNSMSDLFHPNVPDGWIDRIFAVMALCPQHTFQVLTKRPEMMREYFQGLEEQRDEDRWWNAALDLEVLTEKQLQEFAENCPELLPNVHLGVSVEDQATADERIPLLLQTPAALRFVSAEPLLSRIDLGRYVGLSGIATDDSKGRCVNCGKPGASASEQRFDAFYDGEWACSKRCEWQHEELGSPLERKPLDWVIVGGESGPGARPMHPDWARGLRDQCVSAGVPFFFKQWGEFTSEQCPGVEVRLDTLRPGQCVTSGVKGHHTLFTRVGKKAAGALLDGRVWKDFPK